MSRAAWAWVGVAVAAALALAGYLAGRWQITAAWRADQQRAAAAADSLRHVAAGASASADAARGALDRALAAYDSLAQHPDTVHLPGKPDTVKVASDTSTVVFGMPVWHPGLDQLAMADTLRACQAVVDAARHYRTACEAARDSLTKLLTDAARRPALAAPSRWAVVAGGGPYLDVRGRAGVALSVTAGWCLVGCGR